ncbi:MAG TPA: hypothetical protein VNN77_03555 [candidate division Zixibacteria bacterium]|nr:hypothetical protein [candidate division Zixibacteria bacterium]
MTAESPLFEPVLWDGDGFRILDETALPERIAYLRVREIGEAVDAVREMKTRAFGQVLAFLYSAALLGQAHGGDPESLRERLGAMTERFRAARPTFDFAGLAAVLESSFERWPKAGAGEWVAGEARRFAAQIVEARRARARHAAALLPESARVLTHCNISGELVAVAAAARAAGKDFSVMATETRPYLQGSRLTAWELARAGIDVAVIPDCAVAQAMARGAVNCVLVGSDRVARNGDIVNKVGTYPLALMAREYRIPFYALVQEPRGLERGGDAPIEERPGSELLTFQGRPVVPAEGAAVAVRYPAFDITPGELITSFVTFEGVLSPAEFRLRYAGSCSDAGQRPGAARYLLVYGVPGESGCSFLRHALKAEEAENVLVAEMRPELRGARQAVPALLRRGVPTALISDAMMGALFSAGEIAKVYLFYQAMNERGVVAPCGALLAAQLARLHGVAVELIEAGEDQAQAADRDVATFLGSRVCPEGASIYAVENDALPWAVLRGGAGGEE